MNDGPVTIETEVSDRGRRSTSGRGEALGLALFLLSAIAAVALAWKTTDLPESVRASPFLASLLVVAGVLGLVGWLRQGLLRRRERRFHDLLDQAEDRLASQLKERKTIFRAVIQDINAPVLPIRAQLQTLENDRTLTGPQRNAVRVILSNVRRLERLMEDLAALHDIEGGAFQMFRTEVDLRDLLNTVAETRRPNANELGIDLTLIAKTDLLVDGDPERLRRVLDDLVVNVLAYSARGAQVQVIGGIRENRARIEIRDGARGFTEREMAILFRPIGDVHKAGERRERGTGLDLMIAKRVIEAHNGQIWVENRGANVGASFLIEMPLRPRPNELAPSSAPVPTRPI